jgi:DeoR family transcriptional regulator of aga operon
MAWDTSSRRTRMVSALRAREYLRVQELGEMFGVSQMTVRSDLGALAARGEVRRVHGGAMPAISPGERASAAHAGEKAAIGAAAAELVRSGDVVALDVGTTTASVAAALRARTDLAGVTVLTNGITLALELERASPRVTVVVTGGTLRPLGHSLVQPLADRVLDGLHPDIAIVGCHGFHPERGVTTANLPEAETKRLMLAAARRRVIVADGSKLGDVGTVRVCDIGDVDLLLTGASAPTAVLEQLRGLGVAVGVAA